MEITAKDLRSKVGAALACVDRGETVTITYLGKPRARLVGVDPDQELPMAGDARATLAGRDPQLAPAQKGPTSAFHPFPEGATVETLVAEACSMRASANASRPNRRSTATRNCRPRHRRASQTTLIFTGTGSGQTEWCPCSKGVPSLAVLAENSGYSCVDPRGDVAWSGRRISTVDSEGQ